MTEVTMPVGMSAGGDNMYYVDCDVLGQKKAYAACLHIQLMVEGATKQQQDTSAYSDCFRAINRGSCPALALRKEEKDKGRALYYIPRSTSTPPVKLNKQSQGYAHGWNRVPGKLADDLPHPRGQISKNKSEPKEEVGADYAAVVNTMMKEAKQSPKIAEKPVFGKIDVTNRPSLAELARMARKEKV